MSELLSTNTVSSHFLHFHFWFWDLDSFSHFSPHSSHLLQVCWPPCQLSRELTSNSWFQEREKLMGSSALTDATAAIDSWRLQGAEISALPRWEGGDWGQVGLLRGCHGLQQDMPRSTSTQACSIQRTRCYRYSSSCSQSPPPLQPSWTALKHQKESEEENPPMLVNGFTMTEEPVIFLHFFFWFWLHLLTIAQTLLIGRDQKLSLVKHGIVDG